MIINVSYLSKSSKLWQTTFCEAQRIFSYVYRFKVDLVYSKNQNQKRWNWETEVCLCCRFQISFCLSELKSTFLSMMEYQNITQHNFYELWFVPNGFLGLCGLDCIPKKKFLTNDCVPINADWTCRCKNMQNVMTFFLRNMNEEI